MVVRVVLDFDSDRIVSGDVVIADRLAFLQLDTIRKDLQPGHKMIRSKGATVGEKGRTLRRQGRGGGNGGEGQTLIRPGGISVTWKTWSFNMDIRVDAEVKTFTCPTKRRSAEKDVEKGGENS